MKQIIISALISTCLTGCGLEADPTEAKEDRAGESSDALTNEDFFEVVTFGGNGRTCRTCHGEETGTFSIDDAQALFDDAPTAPLFRSIDSDDGVGNSFERLRNFATIRITISLHPNVSLADSTERSVVVERGSPTTLNTPSLDPVLMADGREHHLTNQALSAVDAHFEPTEEPTERELERIALYERTLFSSDAIKELKRHEHDPGLPQGTTNRERRGRRFFESQAIGGANLHGFCALCHSGAMLNETNEFNIGTPLGTRFFNILTAQLDTRIPTREFLFLDGSETPQSRVSSDPGRALITGKLDDFEAFKIPSLHNIKNTAPYFHNSLALTLPEVVNHYGTLAKLFFPSNPELRLSSQDKRDIAAFLELL